jgi:ABC-type lipoprotein export system ATPase subunit
VTEAALHVVEVHKTYWTTPPVCVLRGANFTAEPGERVAVVGRSGSGKSTLLNILGLLDTPTAGRVEVHGEDTGRLSARGRDNVRTHTLGFVFQEAHILGYRTVTENVELKLAVAGIPHRERAEITRSALQTVQLAHRETALARLLSGGEKQRLAVARAIVTGPRVLLADEPTGNLDPESAGNILALFEEQAARGVAVVVITHDLRIAAWADRVVHLDDGLLTDSAPASGVGGHHA